MPNASSTTVSNIPHAVIELPSVTIDSYNVELRDGEGFIGDRASNRAGQPCDYIARRPQRARRVSRFLKYDSAVEG